MAFGFLNINKPLGITSHDVVAVLRRKTGIRKIGHAGTLDPLASGVLILCIGAATRLSEYVMASTKRYRAQVRLGVVTTTDDAEGEVVSEREVTHLTSEVVERVLPRFVGELDQFPPMYSAVKQGGKKLYELARAGQTVERQPRRVHVTRLELVDWSPPIATLDVTCSAGTYIRSLAFDIGNALDVGGSLSGLVRIASGRFTVDNATSLDDVLAADNWQAYLVSPQVALADWPSLHLNRESAEHLRHGRPVPGAGVNNDAVAMAYDPVGHLLAVVQARDEQWYPQKVFNL